MWPVPRSGNRLPLVMICWFIATVPYLMVPPVSSNCTWTLCYLAPPAFCPRPHVWRPCSTDNKGRPDNDCTHWSPIDGRMHFWHRIYLHIRQMRCRASLGYCHCRRRQLKLINCMYFNKSAFHSYICYLHTYLAYGTEFAEYVVHLIGSNFIWQIAYIQ